jgi:hypothetical protein
MEMSIMADNANHRWALVFYDPTKPGNWDRALQEAQARRGPNETGTMIAVPKGARWMDNPSRRSSGDQKGLNDGKYQNRL